MFILLLALATQLVIETKEKNLLAVLVKQKEVNARHYVLAEKRKAALQSNHVVMESSVKKTY